MLSRLTTKAGVLLYEIPGTWALKTQAFLAKVQKHHVNQIVPIA